MNQQPQPTSLSSERKARISNGLIIFVAGALAILLDARFIWILVFMGASLIFSGVTNFCGFAVIFDRWDSRKRDS
jgi:hypothetical protein